MESGARAGLVGKVVGSRYEVRALLARGGRLREPHGFGVDPTLMLFIDESSRALACPCLAVVVGTGAAADFCPISAGASPAR